MEDVTYNKKAIASFNKSAEISQESFIASELVVVNFEFINWRGLETHIDGKINNIMSNITSHSKENPFTEAGLEELKHSLLTFKEKYIFVPLKQTIELMLKDFMFFMMEEYSLKNFVDIAKFKHRIKEYQCPSFFLKHKVEAKFNKYLEILMVQYYQYVATFKFFWQQFFIDDYYNCLDNNFFEIGHFKGYIINRSRCVTKQLKLNCMENAISFIDFQDAPVLHEYCTYIGITVMGYQSNIRRICKDTLKELNDRTQQAKFMTKHIVIAKIVRQRYEQQYKKMQDSQSFEFFDGIDSQLIEKFWEYNIWNFDKLQFAHYDMPSVANTNEKVIEVYYCVKEPVYNKNTEEFATVQSNYLLEIHNSNRGIHISHEIISSMKDELVEINEQYSFGLIFVLSPSNKQFLVQVKLKNMKALEGDYVDIKTENDKYELLITPMTIASHKWKSVPQENRGSSKYLNLSFKIVLKDIEYNLAKVYKNISDEYLMNKKGLQEQCSLGRLITDLVFTKKTLKEVLIKFENTAMTDSTIKFVQVQLPLVGGTLITVMTAYGLKKICSSDQISNEQKMKDVVKELGKAGILMSVAVSGGIIGQIAIPVPVVGALIGTAVGGALGSLFSFIFEKATRDPPVLLSALVKKLKTTRLPDGTWKLDGLEDNERNFLGRLFELSKPKNLHDRRLWLTLIIFLMFSLHLELKRLHSELERDKLKQKLINAEIKNEKKIEKNKNPVQKKTERKSDRNIQTLMQSDIKIFETKKNSTSERNIAINEADEYGLPIDMHDRFTEQEDYEYNDFQDLTIDYLGERFDFIREEKQMLDITGKLASLQKDGHIKFDYIDAIKKKDLLNKSTKKRNKSK